MQAMAPSSGTAASKLPGEETSGTAACGPPHKLPSVAISERHQRSSPRNAAKAFGPRKAPPEPFRHRAGTKALRFQKQATLIEQSTTDR